MVIIIAILVHFIITSRVAQIVFIVIIVLIFVIVHFFLVLSIIKIVVIVVVVMPVFLDISLKYTKGRITKHVWSIISVVHFLDI